MMGLESGIDALLEKKAYLIDIFPQTVPRKADNRYFAVEKIFQKDRTEISRKFQNLLLKLYCYYDFEIPEEDCRRRERTPQEAAEWICKCCAEPGAVNILLPEPDALITLDGQDLYMTVYDPDGELKDMLAKLCASEGLFFYEAPDTESVG